MTRPYSTFRDHTQLRPTRQAIAKAQSGVKCHLQQSPLNVQGSSFEESEPASRQPGSPPSRDKGTERISSSPAGSSSTGSATGEQQDDSREALYVNARQYHRILKRRVARERFERAVLLLREKRANEGRSQEAAKDKQADEPVQNGKVDTSNQSATRNLKSDKKYMHESRHRHAMKRPRGPGGRFLKEDEVERLERMGHLRNGEWVDGLSWRKVPGIDPKVPI